MANGQYLLVSRAAYDALGGHEALRGEIVEDLEFARRLKADGRFRLLLASGESLAGVRMYHSLGEIRRGFTKNAFAGAKGDVASLLGGVVFLLTISALPPCLAGRALAARRYGEATEALACTLAVVGAAAWGFGRVRLPRRLAVFAPLGIAAFAAIALESAALVLSGRGVRWRGRTYLGRDAGKAAPPPPQSAETRLRGAGAPPPLP